MKAITVLTAILMACSESGAGPAERNCTRPDSGTPCTQPNSIVKNGSDWTVTVYTTRVRQEGYTDNGYQCVRNVTTCEERVCYLRGVPSTWTDQQAYSMCRD